MENRLNKLKVVWICHFNNSEIEALIKPYKKVGEFAPWITDQIKIMELDERFELYIISPYKYITGVRRIKLRGVNYFFYNSHMPIIGRPWPSFFKWDYISNFYTSKLIVKWVVSRINPDVIHLQTAENAYISSTILPLIGKYPIITGVQGFISQARYVDSIVHRKKLQIEKEIFTKLSYAFYRTEKMREDLISFNNNLNLFPASYPIQILNREDYETDHKIEFDIVFFARVTREKGIFDLIDALALLKKQGKCFSLCVIGGGNKSAIMNYAKERSVDELIEWKGFIPKQEDVYKEVVKCRICVLPTYFDIIPGTIIQSMFLKLPVVSYSVGSIPHINANGEIIKLVPRQDVNELTSAISEILSKDDKVYSLYVEKARQRAIDMFVLGKGAEDIKCNLLDGYQATIKGFNNNF